MLVHHHHLTIDSRFNAIVGVLRTPREHIVNPIVKALKVLFNSPWFTYIW